MTLADQIQTYKLEEDLDDLIVDTVLNAADAALEKLQEAITEEDVDEYYRGAYAEAASVHHKSVQERVEWLKQHGWDEEAVLSFLVEGK